MLNEGNIGLSIFFAFIFLGIPFISGSLNVSSFLEDVSDLEFIGYAKEWILR